MNHELKTWPQYFEAIERGEKTFDVRKDDRGFAVLDVLYLREYDPESEKFTGRMIVCDVTYILRGPAFGIEAGYCVMAIKIV